MRRGCQRRLTDQAGRWRDDGAEPGCAPVGSRGMKRRRSGNSPRRKPVAPYGTSVSDSNGTSQVDRARRRRRGYALLDAPAWQAPTVYMNQERRTFGREWLPPERTRLDSQVGLGVGRVEIQGVGPGRRCQHGPVGGRALTADLAPRLADLERQQERPARERHAVVEAPLDQDLRAGDRASGGPRRATRGPR